MATAATEIEKMLKHRNSAEFASALVTHVENPEFHVPVALTGLDERALKSELPLHLSGLEKTPEEKLAENPFYRRFAPKEPEHHGLLGFVGGLFKPPEKSPAHHERVNPQRYMPQPRLDIKKLLPKKP